MATIEKTKFYHLIILDESGSMDFIKHQTVSGCNETLNTIRSQQEENPDTQEHFVSIYVFQGGSTRRISRYLIKNTPIDKVENVNDELYEPWGSTPLYDAVGSTLVDLRAVVSDSDFAVGNVTIITDGMENDSKHYTLEKVRRIISSLKEIGWNFSFIGANIDVERVSHSLHIDNHLAFKQTQEDTRQMFERERRARKRWAERTSKIREDLCEKDFESHDDFVDAIHCARQRVNVNYFNAPDEEDDIDIDTEVKQGITNEEQ